MLAPHPRLHLALAHLQWPAWPPHAQHVRKEGRWPSHLFPFTTSPRHPPLSLAFIFFPTPPLQPQIPRASPLLPSFFPCRRSSRSPATPSASTSSTSSSRRAWHCWCRGRPQAPRRRPCARDEKEEAPYLLHTNAPRETLIRSAACYPDDRLLPSPNHLHRLPHGEPLCPLDILSLSAAC